MFNKIKSTFLVLFGLAVLWSCESELDLVPEDNRETAASAFEDPAAYKQFLAKLYAGFAISGQDGPAGDADLSGLDEGFSQYMRLYFKLQELTTDEAVIGWNDGTIKDLHNQNWTSGNEFIRTMYSRVMYQIAQSNEYLRQTETSVLDGRGVDSGLRAEIDTYRAEARFLRALSYWHALDLYGNPPFVTEEDPVGAFLPEQITSAELFNYIEGELLAIESELVAAGANEYGRADQGALWMLLSKLYLNAEKYTGTPRYADVITYTNKVIAADYSLVDDYQKLFLADNNSNGAQNEIIFPITFDGINTQAYGGMTFIIHAAVGGSMDPDNFGINGGWAGLRTTSALVNKFLDSEDDAIEEVADQRALFYTDGQSKEINDISNFTNGYAVAKYKNVDVNGNAGSDPTGDFPDTDFPMFRLADAYLMYAEAVVRGAGGSQANAVDYINELRERAFGNADNNISTADLSLNFILNERARELYWEAHRRTDLIRFGQFSDGGVWPFKGGVPQGTTTEAFRDLFPIPASDLGVNTNLTQNPGY
ncbi:RagB/SusD family nutrient uptake outer membrane protein [Christiangramia sp. SM2212]|uniref:RagB/SusD family nutrient uptake outer membrane protein n=1 Tax=Christiangramia sediminicola TaxID=3073267 RepID=A0ABU1EQL6_9FLAO|nr:RagB/SusD family nutrient uptake outer membrane protein [Christiangramia sp. SM2212]MDR5590682.1 RagB/SusD family nutrient uptake outer membrane protein [Christiangramia sp. SM2212]